MRRFRPLPVGDTALFAAVIALSVFGVAMIYSAGVLDVPSMVARGAWRQQLLWFSLALIAMPLVMSVPVRWLEFSSKPFYVLALILLILTVFVGTGAGTAEGVKSWLAVGPVNIQTAEVGKIATILMLARVLGQWREAPKTLYALWKPIAVAAVPMGLIMLQPDIGSALALAAILIAGLYWAGTPLLTLFFLVSPVVGLFLGFSSWMWAIWTVVLTGVLILSRPKISEGVSVFLANAAAGVAAIPLWESLEQYQKNRILVFLDPSLDPRGAGYNLIQSRVAVGSGGLLGKGFTEGTQKRLAFLPEQHTDFIFSVVGEETGFLGAAAVILAFGFVFWRLVRISEESDDPFAGLVPFCLMASWFTHVLVSVGMTVGIMPITGIPLPFISYGGSFLFINLIAMAVVQRIAAENRGGG
ncbi:MAG: rod shape-determining protein RodA [Longimicrobiaceae bacterium]